jgi:phage/plasmid-associated DNA primase
MSEPIVWITQGIAATPKKCRAIPLSQVEAHLKKHTNSCERTLPHELDERIDNRVFVDFDGFAECEDEDEFDALVSACHNALKIEFGVEGALMDASRFAWINPDRKKNPEGAAKNKLSFNFVMREKHGDRAAIKHYVEHKLFKRARKALAGIIPLFLSTDPAIASTPTYLDVDLGLYAGDRKMRCLGSSKDKEIRPKVLINADQATVLDTLITFIPQDSVALPPPPQPRAPSAASVAPAPLLRGAGVAAAAPVAPEGDDAHIALMRRVLQGIKPQREWVRVGMACKNEGLPLEAWSEWSSPHPHYKAEDCEKRWNSFRASSLSQAFLWKLLKQDDIALFRELQGERSDFRALLQEANHASCAQYFYNLKPDSYAFSPVLKWFALLPTGAWQQTDEVPSSLKTDLWRTLKSEALAFQSTLDVAKEAEKELFAQCKRFLIAIGNASFCEGICKFLPTSFENADLHQRMDERRDLFAFRDCVFELDTGVVRPIRPEDYISLTCGYDFPRESSPAMRARITALLHSIWEDEESTQYMLNLLAKQLHGAKTDEEVYVSTGTGRNGKGLLSELVKRAFGGYFHTCEHNLITKKSDKKDAPNPALFKAKGKRILQVQEPEADDKLQIGTIKELSGGDVVTARDLYTRGGGVSFVPQFSLWIQANTVPKLNKLDRAIGLRLVVLPFPFQFCSNPAAANERLGDPTLKKSMANDETWRNEFVLMLLERAVANRDAPLVRPRAVCDASDEYLATNDPVCSWLAANFVFQGLDVNDKHNRISSSALLKRFLQETDTSPADMSADKFKDLAHVLHGVGFKREKNPFNGVEWHADGSSTPTRMQAGSYFVGIRPKQSADSAASARDYESATVADYAGCGSAASAPVPVLGGKRKRVAPSETDF